MFLITLYWYVNIFKKWIGLVHDREPYFIGRTKLTMDEAYDALIPISFQWDFFAWEDLGEGVSARKLYSYRQIHVRVFTDGEVRVHDELNYEFNPWGHYNSETLTSPTDQEIQKIVEALKIQDE